MGHPPPYPPCVVTAEVSVHQSCPLPVEEVIFISRQFPPISLPASPAHPATAVSPRCPTPRSYSTLCAARLGCCCRRRDPLLLVLLTSRYLSKKSTSSQLAVAIIENKRHHDHVVLYTLEIRRLDSHRDDGTGVR